MMPQLVMALLWAWFWATLAFALIHRKRLLRMLEETYRNAPPLRYRIRRWYRRHRAEIGGIGFVIFLIACYLLLAFIYP